MYLSNIYSK